MKPSLFEKQVQHFTFLVLLLTALTAVCYLRPDLLSGQWMGISTTSWFIVSVWVPVVHQVYVWLTWRSELHYGLISKRLGCKTGFGLYAIGFALLFGARLVALVALAISNAGTLSISPALAYGLAVGLAVPWSYAIYSVMRYFGIRRAFGIDHFNPVYRDIPFVNKGIFRFTSNGMYGPGFLIVWIPGLATLSEAALLAGFFHHAYIWVHYFFTELPDIQHIYGSTAKKTQEDQNNQIGRSEK